MKPTKFEAILALVGGGLQQEIDGSFVYLSGQTPPSVSEIDAKFDALTTEWDSQEYARKRQAEYPSVGDQLDEIYHNGIDSWKAKIKVIKDKYPK